MDRISKSKRTPEVTDTIATNATPTSANPTNATHTSAWRKTTIVLHTPDADVHPVSDLLSTTTREAVPMGVK
jgi:hypothetical protein